MQKKHIGIASLALLSIMLFSFANAKCYDYSYTNKGANAYVKICEDGKKFSGQDYFLDGDYIKVSCNGELYFANSKITCGDTGCSGEKISSQIDYFLSSKDANKKLFFTCYNFDEVVKQNTLATNTYSAWAYITLDYEIKPMFDCKPLSSKCSGTRYYSCSSLGKWEDKGVIEGKCGVKCTSIGKEICDGKNVEYCNSNYQLVSKGKVLGKCGYGYFDAFKGWLSLIFGYSDTGSLIENKPSISMAGGSDDK